jgi:clan AA aspartic protease
MDACRVHIEIGDTGATRFEGVDALVDTGATYTWVPSDVLHRLGLEPDEEWDFVLADGRTVLYGIAWATVRLDGHTQPTPVIFGDPGTEPLLGVVTLEEFRLGVDAVNQRLIHTPGLLK